MGWTYRQLQQEIAARLKELRRSLRPGCSPEEVARLAKERGMEIGSRTIRDWEAGEGNPSLQTLYILLNFYGIPMGDFFRFATDGEDGRFVADVIDLIRDPKMKRHMKEIVKTLRS